MLHELEWPSLEALRDRSSLLLIHKIHSDAVSIENDKYLTPAYSLKITRSSHSAQYCRYKTYSDALKISFTPELQSNLVNSKSSGREVLFRIISSSNYTEVDIKNI